MPSTSILTLCTRSKPCPVTVMVRPPLEHTTTYGQSTHNYTQTHTVRNREHRQPLWLETESTHNHTVSVSTHANQTHCALSQRSVSHMRCHLKPTHTETGLEKPQSIRKTLTQYVISVVGFQRNLPREIVWCNGTTRGV